MTTAPSRPRIVTAAFWSWMVAAVLLVTCGLVLVVSAHGLAFYVGFGVIFLLAGVVMVFLTARARLGDKRFIRAAVALSLAAVVLLVGFLAISGALFVALVGVLLMIGAFAATRPSATAWFDAVQLQEGQG